MARSACRCVAALKKISHYMRTFTAHFTYEEYGRRFIRSSHSRRALLRTCTRLATLHSSAMMDPSHPDTNARCVAMTAFSWLLPTPRLLGTHAYTVRCDTFE